jgi:uncharacterized membrane protein
VVSGGHSRRLDRIALALLLVALVAGAGLRVYAQRESPNVQHDEAWSYASAAGRLDAFQADLDGGLTGRWVPASEWQQFWHSSGAPDYTGIASGLSSNDVHPPLYFTVLHGWLVLTGEEVWTGRALNLVFAALTVLCIAGLARAVGLTLLDGALAALVWAVSPAVVSISALTRQYDLVALTAVLLVWSLARATAPRSGWRRLLDVAWVAAATAAALMTHYQLLLLVAGGVVYVLGGAALTRHHARPRPWWPALAGLAAGCAAAAVLIPGWWQAFSRERAHLRTFSASGFVERLDAIGQTLARFAGVPGLVAGAALVALLVLLVVPASRRAILTRVREARPGWRTILFFALVTAGGVCLQNLLFLSMPPRISARYLAMAWPFLAFVPLMVFGCWPRARYWLTAALCALVLVPATVAAPLLSEPADRLPLQQLSSAGAVLIDDTGVAQLARFLWSVPADAQVFADTQRGLVSDPAAWSDWPSGTDGYYVSSLRPGASVRHREEILAQLRLRHEVTLVADNGVIAVYAVTAAQGR